MNLSQLNPHRFNPEILYIYHCSGENYLGENHYHDFLEMSIILNGTVSYNIEGEILSVKEGDLLIFNPGVHHFEFGAVSEKNTQLHIGFRNFFIDGFPRNTFPITDSFIRLHKYHDEILSISQGIIHEERQKLPGYEIILKSFFMSLIILILRGISPEKTESPRECLSFESKEKQQIVNTIITYMEDNYMQDISLAKLSKNMYLSSAYISKIFKEETGDSPINYLIHLRLSQAKKLLQSGQNSVKSVAKEVGYEDVYHFSKLFKKHHGYPPSQIIGK